MTLRPVLKGVRHTVPVALLWQLVELVKRWHVPPDELLAGSEFGETNAVDAPERIPLPIMCNLLQRARLLTGEAGLGYYLGLHTRVSLYGYVGFAALTAASVRDALELAVRFAPVFSTALLMRLGSEGSQACVSFEERADFGEARDIVLTSMMLGMKEVGNMLTGRELEGSMAFAIPRPDYFEKFWHLDDRCRFGQSTNRVLFDAAVLDMPIVLADRAAQRIATQMCERALNELGFDTELGDRVSRLLWKEEGGLRPFEEIATRLNISPRTLKRRLAAQGLSFSRLVEGERQTKALQLLRSSRVSLDEVARALGYTSATNFGRAFLRWTGKTPTGYRRTIWGGQERTRAAAKASQRR